MQIVIDIDEELYNKMKTYQGLDNAYFAIKHGIPLPKVHEMREATPEEIESVNSYIRSISKPTGVNIWDEIEKADKAIKYEEADTRKDRLLTRDEAIQELKSDIEWSKLNKYPYISERKVEALQMAIKALKEQEPCETIKDIPKDYKYDTETKDFLVYRHMYTGHEIHIEKPVPRYRLEQQSILDKIRAEIEKEYLAEGHSSDYWDGIDKCLQIIDKYKAESEE